MACDGQLVLVGPGKSICSPSARDTLTDEVENLVIDDTPTLRALKKVPCSQIHHQHGNRPNLARYVRGQYWVSLAVVNKRTAMETTPIPLILRASNTGKLVAAKVLMKAVFKLFRHKVVRMLVDCWYMRRTFIEYMNAKGIVIIGQARIDTRLYDESEPRKSGQRDARRKYGPQLTLKRIAYLKKT